VSASTGKKYERELVNKLRDYFPAERVPRSVADASQVDDVIVWPYYEDLPDAELPDDKDVNPDRPLTTRLQSGAIGIDELLQVEVTYTSGGAYGVTGLLSKHLETVGLGGISCVSWGNGWRSGGLKAWAFQHSEIADEVYEVDDTMAKGARQLVGPSVDGAAIRSPRNPWVMVWREVDGE